MGSPKMYSSYIQIVFSQTSDKSEVSKDSLQSAEAYIAEVWSIS